MKLIILTAGEPEAFRLITKCGQLTSMPTLIVDDCSPLEYLEALRVTTRPFPWMQIDQHPWGHNFAAHRNWCLLQVPRDEWVVFLDADEWIDDNFFIEISRVVDSSDKECYLLPRIYVYMWQTFDIRYYPLESVADPQPRLLKNTGSIYYVNKANNWYNVADRNMLTKPIIFHLASCSRNYRYLKELREVTVG